MPELKVSKTSIEGLLSIDLEVYRDGRGWFKENYQEAKLRHLGFPEFRPVQNNFSFNAEKGVTRGIHAEPWNKFISLASGKIFVAIVDLREGDEFGASECFELTPEKAIYVPSGCGNSFQTLEDNVVYTYLVDGHWSPSVHYKMVNLFDPELAIDWPIAKEKAVLSEKDKMHPLLSELHG